MSAKGTNKRVKLEIKTEKDDLKSMSHYVDDRVELVKQMFSCLKQKTIRHLAPDFLKESSLEEIEELCLNELLGLSTKRLLSIINATKCPSDTESSSDSDVHNVDEHISLEEISSESESEKNNPNKQKRTKKDRKAKTRAGTNEKSVSVLELLELQARARAIRSQLALEPVAKIEVDSDDSMDAGIKSNNTSAASSSKTKANSQTKSQPVCGGNLANGSKSLGKGKPIKLKRNFRKQNRSEDDESQNSEKEETKTRENESTEKKTSTEKSVNGEKKTRSPSPDVITILPSPETLCISDSNDEDDINIDSKKSPPKKSSVDSIPKKQEVVSDESKEVTSKLSDDQANKKAEGSDSSKGSEQNGDIMKSNDVEEGEITDNKEPTETETSSEKGSELKTQPSEDAQNQRQDESPNILGNQKSQEQSNVENLPSDVTVNSARRKSTDRSSVKLKSQFSEKRNDSCDDSNQQNDDVISLIHDDLEDDFQETEVGEISDSKLEKKKNKDHENLAIEQPDNDIITLHNSSDEDSTLNQFADSKEIQSWNSRWLKSNRVSKILATSRLGNRVRDKIKKSKKQSEEIEEVPKSEEAPDVFQSQFEEGSVQQYAEILERES